MPDQTTVRSAGMYIGNATSDSPVPLAGVSIEAEIQSFYAKVVVAQRYVNREATPIEAVYVFPLDESAAVCGFEAIVDGTLVVGEVQERDKAFDMYDDAMQQGHGAFLLDEERPDVFQASIGNLPPGKEALVKVTYVTELAVDDGRLRFVIPTTVSPRYAPAEDRTGIGRSDEQVLNPPVSWDVPYGLNLTIRVDMPGRIASIESPSHPISVNVEDQGATVTLGQSDAALDRDFVLSMDAIGLDGPVAIVEHDAIGVAFAPKFSTTSAPAELIFLVDRSGSMQGTSIAEVRNALQLCLRSMTPGCRFNIVGFGSRHESLFPATQAYEQSTLDLATSHVASMEADLGGTELLPALKAVLERPASPELPRQIVILTDGEVTNTDAVIALAKAHAATSRIFAFGIGAGASHHLVRGLARAATGTSEFIHPGERIEPKVLRQMARLLSPALTDVHVEWTNGRVIQAPDRIPPVFANGRLTVYGFVKDVRPSSVRLTATGPSGPLAFEVPLAEAVRSTRTVSTLAARARIRELEEGTEWLALRGSQQKDRKAETVRKDIIDLSIRYGLISRETSFVAIERRDTPVVGDVKLRKIPIALTAGWGDLGRRLRRAQITSVLEGLSMPMAVPAASIDTPARAVAASAASLRSSLRDVPAKLSLGTMDRWSAPTPDAPTAMQRLVVLQTIDGSWRLTKDLASILGHDLADLTAAVRGAAGNPDEVLRAWATALAIAWLEQNAADRKVEWRLLAEKARKWLDGIAALPPDGAAWHDFAASYLNSNAARRA